MNAEDIKRLLASKHTEDVFVPECAIGSAGSQRLDAWAMVKSWAHPRMIGYEIKTHRSDFLRDNKWTAYLACCNEFSFVCPSGVIQPNELPEHVGLLWVASTGNRFITKRKAPHRIIEQPVKVLKYILFSRAKITRDFEPRDRSELYRDIVEGRANDLALGQMVRASIRNKWQALEREIRDVREKNQELQAIEEILQKHDIKGRRSWQVQNELQRANDGLNLTREIQAVENTVSSLKELVGRLKGTQARLDAIPAEGEGGAQSE